MKYSFFSFTISYCDWSATLAKYSVILEKAFWREAFWPKWSEKNWHSAKSRGGAASAEIIASTICFSNHIFKKHDVLWTGYINIYISFQHSLISCTCRSACVRPAQASHWSAQVLYMSGAHQGPMSVCKRLQTMTEGLAPRRCPSARNLKSALNSQGSAWPVRAAMMQRGRQANCQIDLQLVFAKAQETMWPLFSCWNLY